MTLPETVVASAEPTNAGFVGEVVLMLDGQCLIVTGHHQNRSLALTRPVVACLLVIGAVLALASVQVVLAALLLLIAAVAYVLVGSALRDSSVPAQATIELTHVTDLEVARVRHADMAYWFGWWATFSAPGIPAVTFRAPVAPDTRPLRWAFRPEDAEGEGRLVAWLAGPRLEAAEPA